jgi:uncharacterized protein YdhG (YjbR/CyaY superfamily)
MAKTDFRTVDEYIATFPDDVQSVLQTVRRTIQDAVPEAEEAISYQIPAFKFHGWLLYFSAYKNHYSLSCPPPSTVFEAFEKELSKYEVSKSTIKFPFGEPVPAKLISDMAMFRAKENVENESKKRRK